MKYVDSLQFLLKVLIYKESLLWLTAFLTANWWIISLNIYQNNNIINFQRIIDCPQCKSIEIHTDFFIIYNIILLSYFFIFWRRIDGESIKIAFSTSLLSYYKFLQNRCFQGFRRNIHKIIERIFISKNKVKFVRKSKSK